MSNRVSRRERRRRLYFLRAMCARMLEVADDPAYDLPRAFDVDPIVFTRWLNQAEPVPAWIPPIAIRAYRIPEPPSSRIPPLVWILAGVVLAGVGASLLLRFLLR